MRNVGFGIMAFGFRSVTPLFEGSTRDNRRVPLSGSQFPETQPKTCKALGKLARLKELKSNLT